MQILDAVPGTLFTQEREPNTIYVVCHPAKGHEASAKRVAFNMNGDWHIVASETHLEKWNPYADIIPATFQFTT